MLSLSESLKNSLYIDEDEFLEENSDYKGTGKKIEYRNGKSDKVYSKMTSGGIRYYRYNMGKMVLLTKAQLVKLGLK